MNEEINESVRQHIYPPQTIASNQEILPTPQIPIQINSRFTYRAPIHNHNDFGEPTRNS